MEADTSEVPGNQSGRRLGWNPPSQSAGIPLGFPFLLAEERSSVSSRPSPAAFSVRAFLESATSSSLETFATDLQFFNTKFV